MLFASKNAPHRPGYSYRKMPDGSWVGFHADAEPYIIRKHIDGPLLIFRDGQLHWLSIWERILLIFGLTDAFKLERRLRPDLY